MYIFLLHLVVEGPLLKFRKWIILCSRTHAQSLWYVLAGLFIQLFINNDETNLHRKKPWNPITYLTISIHFNSSYPQLLTIQIHSLPNTKSKYVSKPCDHNNWRSGTHEDPNESITNTTSWISRQWILLHIQSPKKSSRNQKRSVSTSNRLNRAISSWKQASWDDTTT